MKENIGIVYLAAGVSKRFNYNPKFLQKVGKNGETLIECSLAQSLKAGFNKIHIIVSDKTEPLFRNKFGESYQGIPIFYTKQSYDPTERDKPWGQVDALCSLNGKMDYPFVVCNGDDLYGEQCFQILYDHLLSNLHSQNKEAASIWYKLGDVLPERGIVNRGIFEEEGSYVKHIEETPSIFRENLSEKGLSIESKGSMGIFAFHPQTIEDFKELLSEFKKENKENREKECIFGTEISKLIKKKKLKMRLYNSESRWIGITNPKDVEIVKGYLE